MKAFWIEQVRLDEDQDVVGLTAVVDKPFLTKINRMLYPDDDRSVHVARAERGGTELWVELDTQQIVALYRATGAQTESHPLYIPDCYYRLCQIVHTLMED